jgi:hypothetical protein
MGTDKSTSLAANGSPDNHVFSDKPVIERLKPYKWPSTLTARILRPIKEAHHLLKGNPP